MTIQEILNTTNHRPWEIPNQGWKFYQEWNNAIFLHWQVDIEELKRFVPDQLEIDLYEGKPWVSVVAFTMEKIRPKNFPSFPPISNFDEINIRTYVKQEDKSGVYFLSIEGGTNLSCKVAKGISELPYRFSTIKRTENEIESSNLEFNDWMHVVYQIGKEIKEKTELDKWLIERYALYQDSKTAINEFEIHHLQWPINEIDIKTLEMNYQRFGKLLGGNPNKVHFSKGIRVIAWGKNKCQNLLMA
ncbi:DUF2071 domain-containing protein [Muricauda sp. CAU 1633]|uniref:YqjF family protein n=1 Tax=Allomuricauda sp. CAU 1633 TaxID=2816036 RepID=UPI001A8D4E68|nr:DUF2071 domain-containing protein [Muricauda sp. CAU 1633]MBO0324392.1 DUF2071 domain-containing protein [Muricauda sp. CAU 1633]